MAGVRLCAGRRGAVSVEFGLVAVLFFLVFMGVMEAGYDLYTQEALDEAANTAARLVATGNVQNPGSAQAFAQKALCPTIGILLNCSNVSVNLACIPSGQDYYTDSSHGYVSAPGAANTGLPGQFMLLQIWYTGPTFVGALFPMLSQNVGGGTALYHVSYSSAAFVNELFLGGQQC